MFKSNLKAMKKSSLLILLLLTIRIGLFAQVSVNTNINAPDNSAMLDVQSTGKGILIPHMTQTERNSIPSPATGLMIFQTDQTAGFYYFNGATWTALAIRSDIHYIGELCSGGIVFWVDNTGQHGLIVSLVDLSTSSGWSNITSEIIGQTAQSTWNGQANSTAIIAQSGHSSSAAKMCDEYTNADYGTGIYSDWYLPAIDQLVLIYHARYILNKNIEGVTGASVLPMVFYWSSTEYTYNTAFFYSHDTEGSHTATKGASNWVRAVRDF
jgi:hypothetical protein